MFLPPPPTNRSASTPPLSLSLRRRRGLRWSTDRVSGSGRFVSMSVVHEIGYLLRPKSAAWRSSDLPSLSELSLTVERAGAPLGGHNIQVVMGAPDRPRTGLNEQVLLWLPSGWWVTL